jgi:hypothetical protein
MPDSIEIGADVITRDGHKAGTVKDIYGRWFMVDVRFRMDYWLSFDHVTSATPDTVTLAFDRDALADFRSDFPEPRAASIAAEAPTPDAAVDLAEGADVYTSDGAHLGSVAEIKGAYFRINTTLSPDYWLPSSLVGVVDRIVGLSITRAELADYQLEQLPAD